MEAEIFSQGLTRILVIKFVVKGFFGKMIIAVEIIGDSYLIPHFNRNHLN